MNKRLVRIAKAAVATVIFMMLEMKIKMVMIITMYDRSYVTNSFINYRTPPSFENIYIWLLFGKGNQ